MALRSECGYTLTEAMMTVAIVGILAGMAVPLMVNMTNFWRQTNARSVIARDVRSSVDLINRFVRQAQGSTVIIDSVAGQPPYSRISFTSIQGQSISFYQTNNKLFMKNGTSISTLSSNIAYIAFTYPRTDDVSLISVALTVQAPTYLGNTKELQLSIQKVRIMN